MSGQTRRDRGPAIVLRSGKKMNNTKRKWTGTAEEKLSKSVEKKNSQRVRLALIRRRLLWHRKPESIFVSLAPNVPAGKGKCSQYTVGGESTHEPARRRRKCAPSWKLARRRTADTVFVWPLTRHMSERRFSPSKAHTWITAFVPKRSGLNQRMGPSRARSLDNAAEGVVLDKHIRRRRNGQHTFENRNFHGK